eukprot:CAMPEP_0114569930 /NCGR_PEP_ID=MMETSP0114-20121206/16911_1 /TAXON_ID=31324 /ORGANISM="Goniomonas sp, Strain m" /LENGTH=65 /DNA_ID=CAMNT_0001756887 /DNA_START=20 /DNA_END=213 /DNA_ORIENTATION=-
MTGSTPLLSLPLDKATVCGETHKVHGLSLLCPNRPELHLAAETASEHREWVDALQDGVQIADTLT